MKNLDDADLIYKPSKQLYLYKYNLMFNLFISIIKKKNFLNVQY